MLQRHANVISSLFLAWDVVCLELSWSFARLYHPNFAKAVSIFEGWNLITLCAMWLVSVWLFRVHNHHVWHRGRDHGRNLTAALSFFVGLALGLWSLAADPPPLSTFPVFWAVSLVAVAGARAT